MAEQGKIVAARWGEILGDLAEAAPVVSVTQNTVRFAFEGVDSAAYRVEIPAEVILAAADQIRAGKREGV